MGFSPLANTDSIKNITENFRNKSTVTPSPSGRRVASVTTRPCAGARYRSLIVFQNLGMRAEIGAGRQSGANCDGGRLTTQKQPYKYRLPRIVSVFSRLCVSSRSGHWPLDTCRIKKIRLATFKQL